MIARVTVSRVPLAIGVAVFFLCFALLAWFVSRRKGDRNAGPVVLTGVAGVYIAALPAIVGAPKWLYAPGLLLIALSYAMQLASWRRQRAKGSAGPADKNDPVLAPPGIMLPPTRYC